MSAPTENTSGIAIDNNSVYTTETTKVKMKGAVELIYHGRIICSLDAEYDFKDLHPDLHGMALSLIQGNGQQMHLPDNFLVHTKLHQDMMRNYRAGKDPYRSAAKPEDDAPSSGSENKEVQKKRPFWRFW